MKHVILPTDFSIRSLQPIHEVMRYYRNEDVKITLLHLVAFPTGIGDLLFRTRLTDERYPVPDAFAEACEIMANRYQSRITAIKPLIRYGSSAAFLDNLLAGIRADAVFIRPAMKEAAPFNDSVQLMPLFNRCRYENIIEVARPARHAAVNESTVGDLLLAR